MKYRIAWIAFAAVVVSGCTRTIATSIPVSTSDHAPSAAISQAIADGDIRAVYALPQTRLRVKVVKVKDPQEGWPSYKFEETTEKSLVDVPDARHVYAIRHNTSFWADDDLTFEVDEESRFLKVIKSETSDRSLDVASLLGTAVLRGFTGVRDTEIKLDDSGRSTGGGASTVYDSYIDPTEPGDVSRVNAIIQKYCLKLRVSSADEVPALTVPLEGRKSGETKGILYRVKMPYRVDYISRICGSSNSSAVLPSSESSKVEPAGKARTSSPQPAVKYAGPITTASLAFLSGNKSPLIPLSLDRAYFVEVSQNYVFGSDTNETVATGRKDSDSVVAKEGENLSTVTKPSEALSFVRLPLAVVNAVLAVPLKAVTQLYADSQAEETANKAREEAYAAQLEAIQKRLDLMAKRQELIDQGQRPNDTRSSGGAADGEDTPNGADEVPPAPVP